MASTEWKSSTLGYMYGGSSSKGLLYEIIENDLWFSYVCDDEVSFSTKGGAAVGSTFLGHTTDTKLLQFTIEFHW